MLVTLKVYCDQNFSSEIFFSKSCYGIKVRHIYTKKIGHVWGSAGYVGRIGGHLSGSAGHRNGSKLFFIATNRYNSGVFYINQLSTMGLTSKIINFSYECSSNVCRVAALVVLKLKFPFSVVLRKVFFAGRLFRIDLKHTKKLYLI